MTISPIVRISCRSVLKNWRHSLASLLSITAGFLASTLFQGYLNDAALQFDQGLSQRMMLGHFLIEKKGAMENSLRDPFQYSLGEQDQSFLESFLQSHASQVQARVRFLNVQGLIADERSTLVFSGYGYDVNEGAKVRGPTWEWNAIYGKPLHLTKTPSVILISKGLAGLLDCGMDESAKVYFARGGYIAAERAFNCPRNPMQLSATTEGAQLNAVDAEVSGIVGSGFRELDKQFVQMPLELAQQLLNTKKISSYSVTLKTGVDSTLFMNELRQAAQARGVAIAVHSWKEDPKGALYRQSMSLMNIFHSFVLLVIVAVATLAVANTIMTSVALRAREIGTLRSLGYRRQHIAWLFSSEGLFLSILGNALGLVLGIVISLSVSALGITR